MEITLSVRSEDMRAVEVRRKTSAELVVTVCVVALAFVPAVVIPVVTLPVYRVVAREGAIVAPLVVLRIIASDGCARALVICRRKQ